MRFLKYIDDYFEVSLCVTLILSISVILCIQVFMRYVMYSSLSWSEELSRYMFIWLIYLGISYGAKIMRHIKIDAGLFMFPSGARPYVVILGDLIFLIFSVLVSAFSLRLVQRQILLGQESPAIGLPMYLVYLAPAVGFALTSIRQIQTLTFRIGQLRKNNQNFREICK